MPSTLWNIPSPPQKKNVFVFLEQYFPHYEYRCTKTKQPTISHHASLMLNGYYKNNLKTNTTSVCLKNVASTMGNTANW